MAFTGAAHVRPAFEALLRFGDGDALELELQARQFDLQLGLRLTGASREDLEDYLRAVEDAHTQRLP